MNSDFFHQSLLERRTVLKSLAGTGLFLAFASLAFAQFRVEVSGVGMTQLPIVIAPFRGEAQSPQKIGSIVKADLERSGMFRGVDAAGLVVDRRQRAEWSFCLGLGAGLGRGTADEYSDPVYQQRGAESVCHAFRRTF